MHINWDNLNVYVTVLVTQTSTFYTHSLKNGQHMCNDNEYMDLTLCICY